MLNASQNLHHNKFIQAEQEWSAALCLYSEARGLLQACDKSCHPATIANRLKITEWKFSKGLSIFFFNSNFCT